jgi:hypothetical protein
MTFEELGEDFGIGTTTAWEYAHGMAEFLAEVIGCPVESLEDQIAGKVCLVDGTLIPTCNWRHRCDLHSGHRKRYGVNVQIVCDLYGRVNACTHAFPGSWHDKRCFDEAGLATILAGCGGLVADSGYQGIDGVIPIKGKSGRKLTDEEHRFNAQVASIRFVVEQAIAHMKNWRITTTRYRGHLDRINNVILTVVGLQALNDQLSDRTLSLRIIQNSFSEPRGLFNASLITARRVGRATALPDGINRVPIPTSIPSRKDRCDTSVLQA